MNIVLSNEHLGPHNNQFRLPDTEGVDFTTAVKSLSKFMDFYSTEPVVIFEIDLNSFSEDQKKELTPLLKKKNIKII